MFWSKLKLTAPRACQCVALRNGPDGLPGDWTFTRTRGSRETTTASWR